MKVRYHFETIDGTAYSTLDVRPGEENAKSFEAAENIGYSAATAKLAGMERIIAPCDPGKCQAEDGAARSR